MVGYILVCMVVGWYDNWMIVGSIVGMCTCRVLFMVMMLVRIGMCVYG